MPSRRAPVTFVFKYRRVESPCCAASDGMLNPGSACTEGARDVCAGVPVLAGAGLAAALAGAGDYIIKSVRSI